MFGRNPNIPSTLTDNPPAESSEKVRRALRAKLIAQPICFKQIDKVFYKRDDSNRRRAPGVVIGQDGKIALIRHGSIYIRAST